LLLLISTDDDSSDDDDDDDVSTTSALLNVASSKILASEMTCRYSKEINLNFTIVALGSEQASKKHKENSFGYVNVLHTTTFPKLSLVLYFTLDACHFRPTLT
jgi:hypothetical protein